MTPSNIRNLLAAKEYPTLRTYFSTLNINELSEDLQIALIETEAALGEGHHAWLLYRKFKLNSPSLEGKIHLLQGENQKAIDIALQIGDQNLLVEAYLTNGQFKEAGETLLSLEISASWYYNMGRVHGHLLELPQALNCLEKAYSEYVKEDNKAQAVSVLALMANYLYQLNEFDQSLKMAGEVRRQLKDSAILNFTELQTDCLLNISLIYLNFAKTMSALRCLMKVKRLMRNAPNSRNYNRAHLLLAYTLRDLGFHKKSLALMAPLKLSRRAHKLNRARSAAQSQAAIGDFNAAFLSLKDAALYRDPSDPLSEFFLPVETVLVKALSGEESAAREQFAQLLPHLEKNEDAHFFACSHLGYVLRDEDLSLKALEYNKKHNFALEMTLDSLVVAIAQVRSYRYEMALSRLQGLVANMLPTKEAHRLLLMGVCHFKLNQHQEAQHLLTQAYEILRKRDEKVLLVLTLYAMTFAATKNASFKDRLVEYRHLFSSLTAAQKTRLQIDIEDLGLELEKQFRLQSGTNESSIDLLEVKALELSSQLIVINTVSGNVTINGQTLTSLDKNPVQKALLLHLAGSRLRMFSKEELILAVFARKTYDPTTDDNLVYVTMNRLRKALPDLIKSTNGCYGLSQSASVVIVTASRNEALSETKKSNLARIS